ncbi:MAG: DUF3575 domain-containing protein [Bacteroidetes bacterium]|nr:DUF3575 domain-containing protein [Bacteroidota bacterium]
MNGWYSNVSAQENISTTDSSITNKAYKSYIIKFENNSTILKTNYDTNNTILLELDYFIKENRKEINSGELKVSIIGYITPFENTDLEKTYSRSFNIKKYLSDRYSITDGFFIIKNEAITWDNEEIITTVSFIRNKKEAYINSNEIVHKASSSRPKKSKKLFGISTNTLYWVALLPNVEVEFFIKDFLSFNLSGQTTWLSFGGEKNLYMIENISPEFRYWFSKEKPFFGHRVGIYGQLSEYDIKLKADKPGNQGNAWGIGATWGYTKPLSIKNNIDNWLLEFTIGVGYSRFHNIEYSTQNNINFYNRGDKKYINYYGITKAKVSITYRFGNKFLTKKRGDNR